MPANNKGKRGCFTADDVRNICCEFACSQGFYGRFVRDHDEADDWQEIADAAKKQLGIEIDKKKMVLASPLRELGETQVPVKVHPKVTANLKVIVKEI